MPYFLAGKPLAKGKSFSAGDTLFPSNFLDLSTAEERSSLGITEESDSPSTAPSETRLAGGNFETSVPTVTGSPTEESNQPIDNEFPDLDDATKSYIDALGQDFFKANIAPRLAGSRFGTDGEGVTYRKPSNLKGGVLSFNRQDKIEPPAPITQAPAPQAPTAQTPAPQAPSVPTTFTPPPGAAPQINYPADTRPNISAPSDDNNNDDSSPPPPLVPTPPPAPTPDPTPTPTPTPPPAPTPDPTPTPTPTPPKAQPQIMAMERFFKPGEGHLQTSNPSVENLEGFTKEGISFNLYKDEDLADASDVYRIFNPLTGGHLLTTSKAEVDAAVAGGYRAEGVTGEAYTSQREGTEAVERYYNAVTGQHLLTRDPDEMASLAGQGYNYEGTAFYAPK